MRAGGLDVAFYIVYVGQGALDEGFARARAQALAKFDAIERMAERYPGHIGLARSAADVERITSEGRLVACIGIENGYAMGEDLGAEFHARGARYLRITNRHSQLGDSNTPEEPLHGGPASSPPGHRGDEPGRDHGRRLPRLEDHDAADDRSLQGACRLPSSVDAVFEHGRNLSDDELRAIKANGGVVQCVAFRAYVKDDGGRQDFIASVRDELGLRPARPRGGRPRVACEDARAARAVEAFDARLEPPP